MGRVLRWVAAAVTGRLNVAFNDQSTLSREDSHSKILQAGLRDLEEIRVNHQVPAREDERTTLIASNREKTQNAIDLDFREFQKFLNRQGKGKHEEIIIYDMEHPTQSPYIIPKNTLKLTTSYDVVTHLMEKMDPTPEALDLWTRCHGRHQHTRDQFSWEYFPPDKEEVVGEMVVELISRPLSVQDRYIVILVLKNNKDMPMIIELPPAGGCEALAGSLKDNFSGSCSCPTLRERLKDLSTTHPGKMVATEIKGQEMVATEIKGQEDVVNRKLCSLKPRTNELLVHWTSLSSSTGGASTDISETDATNPPS